MSTCTRMCCISGEKSTVSLRLLRRYWWGCRMKSELYKQELAKLDQPLRWSIHLKIILFRVEPKKPFGQISVRKYAKLNFWNPLTWIFLFVAFVIISIE